MAEWLKVITMFRFNCHGKPEFDERFKEAINKWAKAKGVNAEDIYKASVWGEAHPKQQNDLQLLVMYENYKIKPERPINTSVFEEAEIID